MSQQASQQATAAVDAEPLTIAILAVGGQGGGVLSNWLLALAESSGWRAQTTSVPGVAQRTGATVYYLELVPADWQNPILGLMPSPASVDVVVAAELMEAGRAIQRGLVAPDRTTVIASNHRSYAIAEKMAPGDGTAASDKVTQAVDELSQRFVHADMQAIAERHDSVISASLFGAIAGANVLPFTRDAFEQTVRDGKVGVEASLAAFADAYTTVAEADKETSISAESPEANGLVTALVGGDDHERKRYEALITRIKGRYPAAAWAVVTQGVEATIDFQDVAYGDEYLQTLDSIVTATQHGTAEQQLEVTLVAARYLAQAMVYDDIIRVADLKTRAGRFARIREDVKAGEAQILHTTEFFHPRLEEICATLPAGLGAFIECNPWTQVVVRPFVRSGRRVRSSSLRWFLVLSAIAGLRRWRRRTLRHTREQAHMRGWLDQVQSLVSTNLPLALEVLKARRLVKGYSDTHARGTSKFDRVMATIPALAGQVDGGAKFASLIDAALADATGTPLDDLLSGDLLSGDKSVQAH
jgi:indolepyruvate ferredoxin oxidoreductase, beta subunit